MRPTRMKQRRDKITVCVPCGRRSRIKGAAGNKNVCSTWNEKRRLATVTRTAENKLPIRGRPPVEDGFVDLEDRAAERNEAEASGCAEARDEGKTVKDRFGP